MPNPVRAALITLAVLALATAAATTPGLAALVLAAGAASLAHPSVRAPVVHRVRIARDQLRWPRMPRWTSQTPVARAERTAHGPAQTGSSDRVGELHQVASSTDPGHGPDTKQEGTQVNTSTSTSTGGPAARASSGRGFTSRSVSAAPATGTPGGGTAGRGSISGMVAEWEMSAEARSTVEGFIAWLQGMAEGHSHRASLVGELMEQYHGRGPNGHAGIPDQMRAEFISKYEEAASTEAAAFGELAMKYANYAEEATSTMTAQYGHEVIGQAQQTHSGSQAYGGSSRQTGRAA